MCYSEAERKARWKTRKERTWLTPCAFFARCQRWYIQCIFFSSDTFVILFFYTMLLQRSGAAVAVLCKLEKLQTTRHGSSRMQISPIRTWTDQRGMATSTHWNPFLHNVCYSEAVFEITHHWVPFTGRIKGKCQTNKPQPIESLQTKKWSKSQATGC